MTEGKTQDKVIAFLSDPASYGLDQPVSMIRTHAACLFLAGSKAYKIKQAVRYSYLDFSTLEKRHAVLARELALNRPAAPQIYGDLVAVTRQADGNLALGGSGQPMEWVLVMNRFPADQELSQIAARGELDAPLAASLGKQIAQYHDKTPVDRQYEPTGLIGEILEELALEFGQMQGDFPKDLVAGFNRDASAAFATHKAVLADRGAKGFVRRAHGDLHLRNIVCLDDVPVPFDALEFDEKLGTMDVLYDLAFLIMDLLHNGHPEAANVVLNRYLYHAKNAAHLTGLAVLPLFLAIRAAIRAMVAVQAGHLQSRATKLAEAVAYLKRARGFLTPEQPSLVAIGGLSGTGKSTLAAHLAPFLGAAPGAIHLRSDLERKAMFNTDEFDHLPSEAYREEVSKKIYLAMEAKARLALQAGHSVILDAVHMTTDQRGRVDQLAASLAVPFQGVWLTADVQTLVKRVDARRRDASDADAKVVRSQATADTGKITWQVFNADQPLDRLAAAVTSAIKIR